MTPRSKTLKTLSATATAALACTTTTVASASAAATAAGLKHKRRYCRATGCTRIVKSQGLCQRHGAKPRMCRVEACEKQAQGNFDGMCKSHFKAHKRETTPLPPKTTCAEPPAPTGESVYDRILPASLSWNPMTSIDDKIPLISHLEQGFIAVKPPAWHRNEERAARGLWPVHNPATQLEGWERELVWMEILILTGNPDSSFRHLARGWGRDKGFHMVLAQFICERHGDVERKKRERTAAAAASSGAAAGRKRRRRRTKTVQNDGDYIGADVWDDTCYGDANYNEALAADLLDFQDDDRSVSDRSFNLNKNGELVVPSSAEHNQDDDAAAAAEPNSQEI